MCFFMFLIHIPSFVYLLLMTFRDVYPLTFDVPISLPSILFSCCLFFLLISRQISSFM
jgi:hypothetical protein